MNYRFYYSLAKNTIFLHKNVRVFSWISINISYRCDIEVFFVLNHPFRGVHFAVNRFTYGQSWLTKGTWFCISYLLLNNLNVMVHLLVKSTYSIRPKSLSNLCRLFRRTRRYFTDETFARFRTDSYEFIHIGVQRIWKSKMTLHMRFARLLA